MYSDRVKQLVAELPNHGLLPGCTHRGRGTNPVCGDVVELFLKVEEGTVVQCHFKGKGCAAALAAAAAMTILCEGKQVEQCLKLRPDDVVDFLQGLPSHKLHGAELAVEVVKRALKSS